MNVELVNVAQVDNIWPLIADRFVKCLEKTPTDIGAGEFWQMCRNGDAFLAVCHQDGDIYAASVWRFQNGAFNCLLMAGKDMREWCADLFQFAQTMARANGCKVTATGRVGLERVLKRYLPGLKITRQTYEIEV